MLLTEARRTARVSASRELVTGWCASARPPGWLRGRYQILAAISAVHTSARDLWRRAQLAGYLAGLDG